MTDKYLRHASLSTDPSRAGDILLLAERGQRQGSTRPDRRWPRSADLLDLALRKITMSGAATLTVTRNGILYSLNKPEDIILAIVEFDGADHRVHYVRQPCKREPDFGVTSVNYGFPSCWPRRASRREGVLYSEPRVVDCAQW